MICRSNSMTYSCNEMRFRICGKHWQSTMNSLLTTSLGSPPRTAFTQWVSWCVYLTDFVRMQPSARSTPPPAPRKDDILETELGACWISGRSAKVGTAANGLTVKRPSRVNSDIVLENHSVSLRALPFTDTDFVV